MDFLGLQKVCLRTDGEPASVALAQAIKAARTEETQLETTPRYSSSSLGAVERCNRSVEGQIRCMRIALEKSADKAFGIEDNILVWLCRHAGWLITRFHVQTDGLTPYQRLKGKPLQRRVGRVRGAGLREGPRHAPGQARGSLDRPRDLDRQGGAGRPAHDGLGGRARGGALQVGAAASAQPTVEGRGHGEDQGDALAAEGHRAWRGQAATALHHLGDALAARLLAELPELRGRRRSPLGELPSPVRGDLGQGGGERATRFGW